MPGISNSKRFTTTKEERARLVIEKGNTTTPSRNKMSEYLSEENVRAFNRIVVSRNFEKLAERHKYKSSRVFNSYDECRNDVEDYFRLCDRYSIIPTIASLALYLGTNKDTIYEYASNPNTYEMSDIMSAAIQTCRGYHEQAFMSGIVSPVAFIFYSKNYYGMSDVTSIQVANNDQTNIINTNTIDTIKEQIAKEKSQTIINSVIEEEQ